MRISLISFFSRSSGLKKGRESRQAFSLSLDAESPEMESPWIGYVDSCGDKPALFELGPVDSCVTELAKLGA